MCVTPNSCKDSEIVVFSMYLILPKNEIEYTKVLLPVNKIESPAFFATVPNFERVSCQPPFPPPPPSQILLQLVTNYTDGRRH